MMKAGAMNPMVPNSRIQGNSISLFFKWKKARELESIMVGTYMME